MFDPLTLNCHSIVNKFTVCTKYNSVLIFWWTDEQIFLPIWIDEIGKNQDKSINETSVSSISTDWSIQSISIKSDLPIFIDLSIDISIPIFIDWSRPLRVICTGRTVLHPHRRAIIGACDGLARAHHANSAWQQLVTRAFKSSHGCAIV